MNRPESESGQSQTRGNESPGRDVAPWERFRQPLPEGHPCAGHERLMDQLSKCGRLFHQRGWSVGTSSNYSVVLSQDPVDLIVTASGLDKGRLNRHSYVRVNQEGAAEPADQPASSAETLLHVVLARRDEPVGCILHTHSIWSTILSQRFWPDRGFWIEGYEMLKGFEGVRTHEQRIWIPIFDNTQDISVLARQVASFQKSTLEKISHLFLIRRHGMYTWGRDVFAARRHVEIAEFLFECVGRQLSS